ncbi:DNA (cytosine-5)-methyltransferase DRM2-like isoform X1 [Lycium barbarum]|uniref:DNA (cytosine-5)-methyltransferase DRM2-like isoform X1 n=2 Tax=Lycium barbarum TaxID=112863 RepID=UPI00293F048E|nr:DNA (cytosine-5)-methyltransferase DRM2-like isoform X1 [Lycium barbarum]XP_060186583.1 DNA (cytosine-5)-methyltransferase DRM2-like isoform X1 [Lycium barbarum]XP_060186584.1 DNA (cytosine-5)-methyltransferase DRM2-like isoform X1 [Lycium barbarum]XP_060186585.1 DNA (cytosine-5)-methyltransferase DRM2-like isoform X1 [Lycium barbarum]XP_060186586.1 DNA (cytosine-5)-methyltransferase DRM2-like isoform X1 [Lycium barbarum]XP_060186587.1 DNA (cytosine-5)-methyltransferase DRM2-like isoform X1
MDKNLSGEDNDSIDWDTEDELEIQEIPDTTFSSCTNLRDAGEYTVRCHGEASSSSVPCQSKFIQQFIVMGFPEESIAKAIEQNGENEGLVLDALLTFKALEDSPEEQPSTSSQLDPCISSDDSSSQYDENFLDDAYEEVSWSSDSDNCIDSADQCYLQDGSSSLSEKEQTLLFLANMGYPAEEASIAMERCQKASLAELIDFMCAAQMAREEDVYLPEDVKPKLNSGGYKKRKMNNELCSRKKQRAILDEDTILLPNPMIGFGVPTQSVPGMVQRTLPEQAIGPPYFYYENVALAPKHVWGKISRFLYDIEPEFVDSKYFCASARKRGYVHNLPIEGRFPLLPLPPSTIHEAFPLTKKWWPSWDVRIKFNCLQTCIGSARLADRIRKALEAMDNFVGEPPVIVQKDILHECRKWNLLWVGRNKVAPLEPDEVEMLLGFPRNHTRGGGISRTDRYKSLGNSFQVDTVAYHLSVLKDLFPKGINVLSLFSGIGGAEVALYRLGIPLNNVVSVEKSEVNRNIVRSWWEQTNQRGNLIDFDDVQELNGDRLEQLIDKVGGFDLVIGGSPCNNLTGSNRVSRDGLEGKDSALFFDYVRILDLVKSIMSSRV